MKRIPTLAYLLLAAFTGTMPEHPALAQSGNVLLNPGFESGTTSWAFYTNGAGSFSSVSPGFEGTRSARISITTAGTNVQFYQVNVPLDPATEYRLRFTAYSNTGRDLSVSVLQNVAPNTNYGLNGVVANLTTGWQTFTMVFTTAGFSTPVTDARLRFWFAPYDVAGDIYYIDNVVLEKTGAAPAISTEPAPQTVYSGQTATFSVTAAGTAPLSYQWQRNGANIPGAVSSGYTTDPTVLADNGASFRCVVTNILGADTSISALLTVLDASAPPTVTQHPGNSTIYTGQTATFTVAATGPPTLTFQWQKNSVDIPGAQSASYTTPPASRADSGSFFRCIVTNPNGSVASNQAMLSVDTLVGDPPVITQHPANRIVAAGQTALFTVAATGTAPLGYQWQRNGVNIGGATSASYTTPATTTSDDGATYRCVVTNTFGTATSNPAVLTVTAPPPAATLLSPQPGDVYKEFSRIMTGTKDWRVTDPNALNSGAQAYKPNPILNLTIADTVGAIRAEAVIDYYLAHTGTANRRFRFNGNSWIAIPELSTANGIPAGASGQCYMQQLNVVLPIPLNHLRQGTNTFEGTAGAQTCYNINWGQWGWYGIIVRVYYNESKGGPRGTVILPGQGGTLEDNPTVAASIQSAAPVNRVEFFASYEGFDPDGDGVYGGYQHSYHRSPSDLQMTPKFHVGTSLAFPFQVIWNTEFVPDQNPGTIKMLARIQDANGLWYVTPEVTGITLQRDSVSVKLYKPSGIPERWSVRTGRTPRSCTISIPAGDSLGWALNAHLLMRTWNGTNEGEEAGETHSLSVNSWMAPASAYGLDNFYSLDFLDVPLSALQAGANTVSVASNTIHHGIDVHWPGPAFIVRYSKFPPQPVAILQGPAPQTVTDGESATFNVLADGAPPISYQWQKNGVNIDGATSAQYVTPPLSFVDNGATFRCVVSNPRSSATSTAAAVTVLPAPLRIVQQPAGQTVRTGLSAVFSVTVAGSLPATYQWRRNGTDIPGATTAWYVTPALTSADNNSVYSCVITNVLGPVTSNDALLNTSSTTPASIIRSDDFNSTVLDSTKWVVINPAPYSAMSLTGTGTSDARLRFDVPGGTAHDMLPGALTAPRLLQPANNTDFEVQLKFESTFNAQYQYQGIIVEQDDRNFMRFEFERRSTSYRIRAVKVVDNVATTQYNYTLTGGPVLYMRVRRSGNTWSHRHSVNGTSWTLSGYFTHSIAVGRVGPWFGNTGAPPPAFTAQLDYFFNYASPISPEDGATFPPAITTQPATQSIARGLTATFSIGVSGTPPFTYQWKRNGADIPGATGATHTTPVLTFADSGAQYTCLVTNSFGTALSNPAVLHVIPDPSGIAGDDFNTFGLNSALWTPVNPLGDAQFRFTGTNTQDARFEVDIPAGAAHDAWTNGNQTFRIMQSAANTDVWIETKFESVLSAPYQIQGLLLEQDSINYIRFDFVRKTSETNIFAASFAAGVPTKRVDVAVPVAAPAYMRVRRTGDSWTQSYSSDGSTWTDAVTFAFPMTLRSAGPFFGNSGIPAPAFTGTVDYFELVNEAIVNEDGGTAVDSFPPVISTIFTSSRVDGFVVSWTTNEPTTGFVDYGLTTNHELGTVSHSDFRTSHSLTVTGLAQSQVYQVRIRAGDAAGNADTTLSFQVPTVTPTPPVINVWYGKNQTFGLRGNPTPAIDLLGNVTDAQGIMALSYSLNGGPALPLAVGPDSRRLNLPGDFNADIPVAALSPGSNTVVITAVDSQASAARETVTVNYLAGTKWPKTYSFSGSEVDTVQKFVQVVDGKWGVVNNMIRTLETGYDRLLAIGDPDWTDYEVTMKVTVHALDPTGYLSPSNGPAIGLILRWPGHSDNPSGVAGWQPKTGYLPLGGFGMHRWDESGLQSIQILGDNLRTVGLDNTDRTLELNTPYWVRMRVQTVSGLGNDYSLKVWQDGTPEPAAWDLSGREPVSAPAAGALLLVAHEVDASIGSVSVTPLVVPSNIVSDDFNAPGLNTALWRFANPRNDATASILDYGTSDVKVTLAVPGGIKHEPWTPGNTAVRILQPANNTSFTVQARFTSTFTGDVQLHGITVEKDSLNFIRFDYSSSGTSTKIFAGTVTNGTGTSRYNQNITTGLPGYMRVRRQGDRWTLFYSYDGIAWVQTADFTHSLVINEAGLAAGNAGTTPPPYTMIADYFFNEDLPIVPEDGLPGGPPPAVVGDPVAQAVVEGDTAVFSIIAIGSPPLTYRWQRNGTDVPGATDDTLRFGPASVLADNGAIFRCIVTNGGGSDTSQNAALTVGYPPAVLVSDDFRNGTLSPGVWTFRNPKNDAVLGFSGAGTQNARMSITVPAGVSHDIWTTGNDAPRVMQDANNTNFDIETKFESGVSTAHQIQGLFVQQDATNFIRFDFVTHSTLNFTRVFAASFVNGVPTTRINLNTVAKGVQPLWLRVSRQADLWTVSYSTNGSSFTTAGSFTHVMTVDSVGVFAGNAGTTPPAFTAVVDYFFNLGDPLPVEDPESPSIVTQPLPTTVTAGRRAVFSVIAAGSQPLSYQWQKNGIPVPEGTTSTWISQPVTLDDNGAQIRCVVSSPFGSVISQSVTLTVNAAVVLPWWSTAWSFRLPVIVGANGFERMTKPVEVPVNFSSALATLGHYGKSLDTNSLRIVEVDSSHAILDTLVPMQFDRDAGFDPASNASGTIVFLMEGNTPSTMTRYFDVYFDTTGRGPFVPPAVTPQVQVFDTAQYQGQASFKIITTAGTYFYHKPGGGFASFIDPTGADWIRYSPGGGALGEYRGIPNTGTAFHPGYTNSTSQLVSHGPLKARIRSTSLDNAWESVWDIFPGYARMVMTRIGGTWWWLYEGTPGGTFEINRDYYRRPNGVRTIWNTKTQGDLPGQEWAYFGDTTGTRILYVAHHEDDTRPELFRHEDSAMTVFGFGRQDPCCIRYFDVAGQTFTFGFGEDSSFTGASRTITSAYKDLSVTTEEAQYQGSTGVPVLSTIVSDNFNTPGLNSAIWTYINPLGDAPLTMTGTEVQINVPAGTEHDIWTGGIRAPRIMQPANNANFQVEAKFNSNMYDHNQINGILVQEDPSTVVRFDIVRSVTGTKVFAGRVDNGVATTYLDLPITGTNPIWLRVFRSGNQWTQFYSTNGSTWTAAGSFADDLVVSQIGVFFGNSGSPVPMFIGLADYFLNLDAPLSPTRPALPDTAAVEEIAVPADFVLSPNFPNPFNPATTIRYGLPEQARVTVAVYNLLGQEVAVLVDEEQAAGYKSILWNAENGGGASVGSGVYFYRMTAHGVSGRTFSTLRKMILLR